LKPWACRSDVTACYNREFMAEFILSILAAIRVFLRSRGDTALEVLALRRQVAVLKRKRPRPRLNRLDRLFWPTRRQLWPRWTDILIRALICRMANENPTWALPRSTESF